MILVFGDIILFSGRFPKLFVNNKQTFESLYVGTLSCKGSKVDTTVQWLQVSHIGGKKGSLLGLGAYIISLKETMQDYETSLSKTLKHFVVDYTQVR